MIASADAEKAFDTFQYTVMILKKISKKQGNFLNLIKTVYKKPTASIILNS